MENANEVKPWPLVAIYFTAVLASQIYFGINGASWIVAHNYHKRGYSKTQIEVEMPRKARQEFGEGLGNFIYENGEVGREIEFALHY